MGFTGCGPSIPSPEGSSAGRQRVVATTGYVADLVKNIGGQHVAVQALMGPGVDPHLYAPTPGDVRALTSADAVFYNGLHLEGRMAEMLGRLAKRRPVYAVTEALVQEHTAMLRKAPGSENTFDPHVWFDVSLWAHGIDLVADRLAAIDPAHADEYRRNAASYRAKLAELHQWTKGQLAAIAKEQRVLVTAHDAFGYFGTAYDVEVHGLQGISTMDEADVRSVNALVDLLVGRKIRAVFVESSVPPRNVQALIQASAARGHDVALGGELFSDAMGAEGTPEGTYVGVVQHNVHTIVKALSR